MSIRTRWFISILLALTVALGLSQQLDRHAQGPVDDGFQRALITFGVVRGINAIISVVQGTELAIEPAGVGVVLAPGQVFDPVNDLIERFSWIMLAASTSFGAQKVLIGVGTSHLVQAMMVVSVLLLLTAIWRPKWMPGNWRDLVMRLAVLALFVRFAVPVMVLANDAVYQAFLADRYEQSQLVLKQTRDDVEALQKQEELSTKSPSENGFIDKLGRWYDRTTESFSVDRRIQLYKERLSQASEHIIHLIVVFMLQTVVFPLLFLWLGLRILRAILMGTQST